jgi:hypothetical protein
LIPFLFSRRYGIQESQKPDPRQFSANLSRMKSPSINFEKGLSVSDGSFQLSPTRQPAPMIGTLITLGYFINKCIAGRTSVAACKI